MSALTPEIVDACRRAADKAMLEPALVCAVIAVESGGNTVEAYDGTTPTVLPEPYWFYRRLPPDLAKRALAAGIASDHALEREDYGAFASTSHARVERLQAMVLLDADVAYDCCSWGLPQIMGFNAAEAGYPTARDMVEAFRRHGATEQVDAMLRLCDRRGATVALMGKDWERFATLYNGRAWRRFDYARRLASAYAEWHVRLASNNIDDHAAPAGALRLGSQGDEVSHVQQALAAAGYPVRPDGSYGPKTQAAVFAFQGQHGLPADGVVGPITRHVLMDAPPVPQGGRDLATISSMVRTNPIANAAQWMKRGVVGLMGGSVLEGGGSPIERAESALWKVKSLRYTWEEIQDGWRSIQEAIPGLASVVAKAAHEPTVWAAIVSLSGLWLLAHRIQGHALSAEQSGAVV